MNQSFNLPRFGRLLRKHLTEHLTRYALGAAVLLGGMLAVLGFLAYVQGGLSHAQQFILFVLALLAAGTFFTTTVLAQFGEGSRAALALLLPASQLEKYLVAWLVSLPMFLVVFVADFYLADWLVLSLSPAPSEVANVFTSANMTFFFCASCLALHGAALWGSIFFRQQQFIKTAFLLFAVALGLGVANYHLLRLAIGPAFKTALPFDSVRLTNGPELSLAATQEPWLLLPLLALLPLLWLAAYARLTEKQL